MEKQYLVLCIDWLEKDIGTVKTKYWSFETENFVRRFLSGANLSLDGLNQNKKNIIVKNCYNNVIHKLPGEISTKVLIRRLDKRIPIRPYTPLGNKKHTLVLSH